MATKTTRKPYFVKVLELVLKNYPGYTWSTEVRFQNDEAKRVLTGGKTFESGNTFAMAVELPDKPMMLKKLPYWRAAAELIIDKIEKAEASYGKKPSVVEGTQRKIGAGTSKKAPSKARVSRSRKSADGSIGGEAK